MPQVIAVAVKYVAWGALKLTGAKIAFATAMAIGKAVVYTALAVGFSSYQRQQAKKAMRSMATLDSGRNVTVREPAGVRTTIYGQMRVGGVLVFAHVSGTNKEYLHLVIAHASHQCEEIGDVYLNDEVVPLDGSGNATGKYAGYVRVKKHLGTDAQTVDTDLQTDVTSSVWSNNHRLRGICYSYVRLRHNPDLFPSGIPNFSAVIKGKLVYDPRTTGTAWSANPALCLRDYLLTSADRGGLGADSSEVSDSAVTTAANICDESVSLNPSGTESRYTCNGVIDTSAEPGTVIASLCSAMAGICPYVGGVFKMKAGAHTASVLSINEDHVRGSVSISTRDSLRSAFNGVKGTYVSSKNDYQIADFPPVVNSTYTTEDGARIWRDIALNFTTSSGMAQRLAKIELERGRQDIGITLRTSLVAIEAHVGDVIDVTLARYGWTSKLFEVVDCKFYVEGEVLGLEWVLRETASGVWDWNSGEETTTDLAPNTTLVDPFTVPTPTSLAALSNASTTILQEDGTVVPRVLLSWAAPANAAVTGGGHAIVEYKLSSGSDWYEFGRFAGSVTQVFIPNLAIGVNFDFRVKFQNINRVSGSYATVSAHTVAGDAAAPAAPTGLVAIVGTGKAVSLDWSDSTEADLGEYAVYRNTVNNAGTATKIAEVRASRFVDADVTLGQIYYYWVTAIDRSENESAKSAGVNATPTTVGSSSVDSTAPATPSAPTFVSETTYLAGDGGSFARITVAAPALPSGAASINVLYRRSGATDWIVGGQVDAAGNVSIDDLSPGVAYEFACRAISFSGVFSADSSTLSRTAPSVTGAPAVPSGVSAAAGTGKSIGVSWNSNTETDLADYGVYRGGVLIARVRGTRFVDTNVSYGVSYTYTVTARNRTGVESAQSSGSAATPVQIANGDIGSDAVQSINVLNGTINIISTAYTAGITTSGGVVQTVSITTTTGVLELDFAVGVYFTGPSLPEGLTISLKENGGSFLDYNHTFFGSPTDFITIPVSRNPGAGTHTYEIEIAPTGGTWEFSHRTIRAKEIKRAA